MSHENWKLRDDLKIICDLWNNLRHSPQIILICLFTVMFCGTPCICIKGFYCVFWPCLYMYLGILGMYSGVTDSIVWILDTWFIDSNIWILDTLYKYLGILLYGFYCINSGVRTPCILFRDFIVCIRYLWILGSPYFGIGLYGFWTSCICI